MVRVGPGSGLGGAPGGGSDDDGGSSGGSTAPDNDAGRVAPDPVDGGGSDDDGGSSGGSTAPNNDAGRVAPRETRTISAGGQSVNIPEIGVGSGPEPQEFQELNRSNLQRRNSQYRENVADPIGTLARKASPASLIDQAIPGNRVGRSVENFTEGAVNLGNAPAWALGAMSVGERVARDTRRANQDGAEGRRQNRQELANDAIGAAVGTGRAIQNDPFGTLSRIAGSAFAGAAASGAAARAVRGTPDVDGAGSGSAVPSGRSNVGTGGVDSLLDDVDVDARRGTSGPSTRSRVEGEVSRAVDDVADRLGDSRVADFLDDTRAQLQQRPASREPDFSDAPDRTRPADAGGTFEDVRQDALTQLQDDLGGRGRRPDPGTFDGAPQPFRSGGSDTIDADGGVNLQRTTGTPEGGSTAGLGRVSSTTDPTGIAPTGGASLGTGITLSAINDPTGITASDARQRGATAGDTLTASETADRLADQFGLGGGLDARNDPTGISDTDTEARVDAGGDDATDTLSPTDTGTDTGTEPLADLPSARTTITDTAQRAGQVTGTDTRTALFGAADTASLSDPEALRAARQGRDDDEGRYPRSPGVEAGGGDDTDPALLGFASDSTDFSSGIASASDFINDDGGRDPFSL